MSGSARRMFAATLLSLEVVIILLTGMAAFGLKLAPPGQVGLVAGVGGFLAIVAAATLRSGIGYTVGWIVQILLVLSGFLLPVMWGLGGVFLLLWAWALATGSRIDRERAERTGAQEKTSGTEVLEDVPGTATLET